MKRYKDFQIYSTFVYRMMMSKISTYDGIRHCFQQTRHSQIRSWQDSVQLQTVMALYDQETVRNTGQTSYSRLKTSVRLCIDQKMRTRNFRARSEVIDRGAVTRSQKGKKANVERKVGDCFQRKTSEQCSKGDSCSSSHGTPAARNCCAHQRRKGQSSSPTPNSKANLTGKGKLSKPSGNKDESTSDRRSKIPCRCRNCSNPSHMSELQN